ncbi:MAG: hypothetical protein ACRYFZ_13105, partial [Janthinobacterium lividum]
SLTQLAEQMGWVSDKTLSAKSAGELLGNVIHALVVPTKLLWGIIADVVKATAEWAASNDTARGFLQALTQPVRDLFNLLLNAPAYFAAFSAAAEASFGGIGRAWAKVKSGEFSGAASEFANLGKNIGDAYRKAFEEAATKKTSSAATSQAAGDDPSAQRAQGGDGVADAARQKAAEKAQKDRDKEYKARKAARDKADQEHLNDIKKWVKEEGDLLDTRNSLTSERDKTYWSDETRRREQQRVTIVEAAEQKYKALVVLEGDHTQEITALVEERDLQLRELQAKFDAQDEADRQKKLEEKIQLNEAETQEALARLQLQLAAKLITQDEYEEAIFKAKMASKDRELALIKAKNGEESAEYKKLNAEKIKEQAAHDLKSKGLSAEFVKFKKGVGKVEELLNSDNVKFLEESLGKQTVLYKAFQVARKLAAVAKIETNLVEEISGYWANSSEFGPYGIIWAALQSGVAVARAGFAVSQLDGYAKGGATGDGVVAPRTNNRMMGMMGAAMGLNVGTSGKLLDDQGLEVAGIVHKNEYVIPAWMREDPQVLQVEDWLETRRMRGYAQGGNTTEGDRRKSGGLPADQDDQASANTQLVQVLASLDQRLRDVEQWPTQLDVVLDLLQLDREQKKLAQVRSGSAVKPTKK